MGGQYRHVTNRKNKQRLIMTALETKINKIDEELVDMMVAGDKKES